jgi:hypothetical protein
MKANESWKKKKEVKKHVAAIQCSNSLSLLQRKISNALLFHAYPCLKEVEEHHITVKQLCISIDYKGNNHAAIKTALKGLIATLIEWDVFDDITGEEDWSASAILASVRIKGPNCYYAYSPRMRDLLYSPSIFAKINLIVQSQFKSNYGLALYENCIRYQGLPQTKWFALEKFKKLMGVASDNYPFYRDFKRRVLDKAVEEVNAYSDLYIQAEVEKAGWKVIRIRFKISLREKKKWLGSNLIQKGRADGENQVEEDTLLKIVKQNLLQEFLVTQEKAHQLIENYGLGYVHKKIELIKNSKNYQNGNIKNVTGYLMDAIKNDYQQINSIEIRERKERIEYEKNKKIQQQSEEECKLKKAYEKYLAEEYFKIFDQFNEDQKTKFILELEKLLKSEHDPIKILWNSYKNYGITSKLIRHYFKKVMKENYGAYLPKVLDFASFEIFV